MSNIPETSTIDVISEPAMDMETPSNETEVKDLNYKFDPCLTEEERRFYEKAYPTVDLVRERKVHCTVCKIHIGTAPVQENSIKMHPILRVTHCLKCHDFYNSGEFSKGEDGSELYCRWCGQGGEVYCCSSCPYVFCKSCIVKNLSRGVVVDIEQNENWNCFNCAPKILWPLRAQHWALMQYIEQQKKELCTLNLTEVELKLRMAVDRSKCCRLAKAKCGNMSDSLESLDSIASRRSHNNSVKKKATTNDLSLQPAVKRARNNDEVVCTPDLMSMLEPDCQIVLSQLKNAPHSTPSSSASISKAAYLKTGGGSSSPLLVEKNTSGQTKSSVPPPLVLRNTAIKVRPGIPGTIMRRTIIGPRATGPGSSGGPIYHTINGYRIDLNSAAQQDTFRLPNGKLIQVKRQGSLQTSSSNNNSNSSFWQTQQQQPQQQQEQRGQRIPIQTNLTRQGSTVQHSYGSVNTQPHNLQGQQCHLSSCRKQGQQHCQQQNHSYCQDQVRQQCQQSMPQYRNFNSNTGNAPSNHNSVSHIQMENGQLIVTPDGQMPNGAKSAMVRQIFPDTPIGQARSKLQDQLFNAADICKHLTQKLRTLTNSNAYKYARNYQEIKELYIHESYLLTYAIGRFKGLQDKCLADMRQLGFTSDADCLENGQLAAGVDYVCYGQLDDVDLFNTGSNSFHNQIYEYRKSLHANLKDEDGSKSPLPPLFPLGINNKSNDTNTVTDADKDGDEEDSLLDDTNDDYKGYWLDCQNNSPLNAGDNDDNDDDDTLLDNDNDDDDTFGGTGMYRGTEDSMRRSEETHAFDRKLTRLVSQYPSIWCTRHPDYGNFEVTRKQWNTIAAHFKRSENIKLRWKNIRKRFVRIEKRIAEGKRFNGHFDKAMAFLANRDLPEEQWVPVDCGDDDGDTYDRRTLDAIERSLTLQGKEDYTQRSRQMGRRINRKGYYKEKVRPIQIKDVDLRIINYVKANPMLWRKSVDPEIDKQDENNRTDLWDQLKEQFPQYSCEDIKDRWQHLYEMYKTFRLKTIKSPEDRAVLELKYSKYLAKLYFLYKIDEEEMRNENMGLFEDCFELDEGEDAEDDEGDEKQKSMDGKEKGQLEEQQSTEGQGKENGIDSTKKHDMPESQMKLQDMPDDKEFLQQLVNLVRQYPAIWNSEHPDYIDIMIRDNYWQEISEKLNSFKHKQASDDEENEVQIIEPQADIITLDSDDEEISSSGYENNDDKCSTSNENNNNDNVKRVDNLVDDGIVLLSSIQSLVDFEIEDNEKSQISQSSPSNAEYFPNICTNKPTDIQPGEETSAKLKMPEDVPEDENVNVKDTLNNGCTIQNESEVANEDAKNESSVNLDTIETSLENEKITDENKSLQLKEIVVGEGNDKCTEKCQTVREEIKDKATTDTIVSSNENISDGRMETADTQEEDDPDDLDVDLEIAKVLRSCYLNCPPRNVNNVDSNCTAVNTSTNHEEGLESTTYLNCTQKNAENYEGNSTNAILLSNLGSLRDDTNNLNGILKIAKSFKMNTITTSITPNLNNTKDQSNYVNCTEKSRANLEPNFTTGNYLSNLEDTAYRINCVSANPKKQFNTTNRLLNLENPGNSTVYLNGTMNDVENLLNNSTLESTPLNLKDTMDRTIEKLIANGYEDSNSDNLNDFPAKEIYGQPTEGST